MFTENNQFNLTEGPFDMSKAVIVNGNAYDIGVDIHKWNDPKGYNGYKEPRRYGCRKSPRQYGDKKKEPIDLIKQFLVHHSGADRKNPGVMFNVLWNQRALSVHFALEDNGEIWQFVDAIEKTSHAGNMNHTSIGVECCHYPSAWKNPDYYSDERNRRTKNLSHQIIEQPVYNKTRRVFSFTDVAIDSLARLAAGCWLAVGHQRENKFSGLYGEPPYFPEIDGEIPWGKIKIPTKHIGLIAHRHCTNKKWDPAGLDFNKLENLTGDYYYEFKDRFLSKSYKIFYPKVIK